jgi:hypothetical protein
MNSRFRKDLSVHVEALYGGYVYIYNLITIPPETLMPAYVKCVFVGGRSPVDQEELERQKDEGKQGKKGQTHWHFIPIVAC